MAAHLLGPAKQILDLGLAIKRAVDTAKLNERECRRVEGTVGRVCGLLQMLGTSDAHVAMLQHPSVAGALDDVVESLEEALALVGKCQRTNSFLRVVTAAGTGNKLKRVRDELLEKVSLCTLLVTTMSAVAMTNYRPQLSGQFQAVNSRSDLALHLRDTYTNGEGIASTCIGVTDQTRMGVAFAMRASGIDYVVQLDSKLIFGIRPLPTQNTPDVLFPLLAPFGDGAVDHGMTCLWRGEFNPDSLAVVFTTLIEPRRRRSTVTIEDDTTGSSNATAPAAPPPLLLPAPVATDEPDDQKQDLEQDQQQQQQQLGEHGEEANKE